MRIITLKVVLAMSLVLPSFSVYAAEDVKVNPHSDTGDCTICHVASAEKLRGWFTFSSTKKELKHDLNQICLNCHTTEPTHAGGFLGVGKGHATGKKTALNRQDLPLANDGTITCATTCHNIHAVADNGQPQPKLLRLPVNSMCMSCHDR